MTENIDPRTDPQFKALMQVMNDITQNKVPFYEPHELAARSTLRALQHQIDDRNVLDDGDLIDTLNQARIEIKYLLQHYHRPARTHKTTRRRDRHTTITVKRKRSRNTATRTHGASC
jgi:hypothetical protein